MIVDYLIIGQGLSGTWLSYYLNKAGKSFLVVDNNQPNAPSRVSAGIINPVTGRRIVKTWMIDELLSFLVPAYEELGKELGLSAITQKNIIDFHPTPQMKIAFEERLKEDAGFLLKPDDGNKFLAQFNYDFGYGIISPCYVVNLKEIIPAWRKKLQSENKFFEEEFDQQQFKETGTGVQYKNIQADKIIFCDGIASAQNSFFKSLPFSFNKGEALIIEVKGIPQDYLFKKKMLIAPIGNNFYWIGSNYEWEFPDDKPTAQFRSQTETVLKNWLKLPFKIADHVAAIRPANIERRPFAGFHPLHHRIGILNGMGAKGSSLAPYFAKELTGHLLHSSPIHPEADIKRFRKILSLE